MPRSSRHKSLKHSGKDAREHSESEDDVIFKEKRGRDEGGGRVSRDLGSSEKRKLASQSQSQEGKDQFLVANGDVVVEEYVASKKRKERNDASSSDRWNGGEGGRDGNSGADKERRGESYRQDSEKGLRSRVSVDLKSKSSRRHEGLSEKREEKVEIVDIEEVKRGSGASEVEVKGKSDKDSIRKDGGQYKDLKDKDYQEERSSRKLQDGKNDRSLDRVLVSANESTKKQSGAGASLNDRHLKEPLGNFEWPVVDDLRNPELEKELEKRIRKRRDDPDDKDKFEEGASGANERRLSNRDERGKSTRHKDEKVRSDDRYKDKHREDYDRDRRHRDDKHRDDRYSKDHTDDRSDKYSRDESRAVENNYKKSKTQVSDHDDSLHHDDRGSRYKSDRVKKRSSDDEDHSDLKPRRAKDHRYEVEKKSNSGKVESPADRGRSLSRHADTDPIVSNSRRKSSPSSSAHLSKDQSRHSSKPDELKYKESVYEERPRLKEISSRELTGVSERASESRSIEKSRSTTKPKRKDDNHISELPVERSPRSDSLASPMRIKEKSHSSPSIDWKHSNRAAVRRSLDVEETGRRSYSSKDARDYVVNVDRGSQEPLDKAALDEAPPVDGDTVSAPSSFNRNSHVPSGSTSLPPPPPPFRTAIDSPSVFGSSEEDGRGKSSNRYKRSSEPNVGRGQENAWKGMPSWPSPAANGFIPFQHGPPSGGFHPMMQQFPASPLFVRPSMELNPTGVPYHISNADRFSGHVRPFGWRNPADEACAPHLHGWDANNNIFMDDPHMLGRPEWDQNRRLMSDLSWDGSSEMWKGPSSAANMEFPPAPQKEDSMPRASPDEGWTGKMGQRSRSERSRSGSRVESIEIKRSNDAPPAKDHVETPVQTSHEKTPETSGASKDNGSRLCYAYLSKLDISVGLTNPELYEQCMSLLNTVGTSTHDDAINQEPLQECTELEVKISNNSSCAFPFPAIKESVLERAMVLYKKQREDAKLSFPKSSLDVLKLGGDPTDDDVNGFKPKASPTMILEEEQVSSLPMTVEENEPVTSVTISAEEEPFSSLVTLTGEKEEPVLLSEDKGETFPLIEDTGEPALSYVAMSEGEEQAVPYSVKIIGEEELVAASVGEVKMEEDCISTEEAVGELAPLATQGTPGEPVPASNHVKEEELIQSSAPMEVEEVLTSDQINQEEALQTLNAEAVSDQVMTEAIQEIPLEPALPSATSPNNEESVNLAGDANCDHSANGSEKQTTACSDTACESIGFTFNSAEAAEALTPESVELSLPLFCVLCFVSVALFSVVSHLE
ncbi:hypothetical protein Syun_013405 [Stephania yunnanensis]|uniref:Uncharacterized protein n=1 Tax=Stephania yunnanensis TaxID=152371 RepID=A0AAP0K287_9MAGN